MRRPGESKGQRTPFLVSRAGIFDVYTTPLGQSKHRSAFFAVLFVTVLKNLLSSSLVFSKNYWDLTIFAMSLPCVSDWEFGSQ